MSCASQVVLEHSAAQDEKPLLRVFLAEDQEEMCQTIAQILCKDFQIVGTAETGAGVLDLPPNLSPDVFVLDISMPVVTGIEAALRLREEGSHAKIIFLTVHEDPDFVENAMAAGAAGYVLKPCMATDLGPAIRKAMEGSTFISPSIHSPKYPAHDSSF
jgi:DNA-binding NarL/FixJ family response regulator